MSLYEYAVKKIISINLSKVAINEPLAELGSAPQRSGDVAEALGLDVQNAAPLRNNLIKKGMIYSPQHGDTAFTVPLFEEFMKRSMPIK